MVDSWATNSRARAVMRANKRRDTLPELKIRRLLHARGLRYKVDSAPVAGLRVKADIVFPSAKVAVFVDGCFWHGCPQHYVESKSNLEYWRPKIQATRARDHANAQAIESEGWRVVRVWEHQAPMASAAEIEAAVRSRTNP